MSKNLIFIALILALPTISFAGKCNWKITTDSGKLELLDEYRSAPLPEGYAIQLLSNGYGVKNYDIIKSTLNADQLKAVDKMIKYLEKICGVYNPDYPFLDQSTRVSGALIIDSSTKEILGGRIYIIKDLVEDSGSAFTYGGFELVNGEARLLVSPSKQTPRWNHY